MHVTRYGSAADFVAVAQPLLMRAEAENNLILGIAQGLVRTPDAATGVYLATVDSEAGVQSCALHLAPFKMVITRADRAAITALVKHAFDAVPDLEGVSGPERTAGDFALAWSALTGREARLAMRLRIHEIRRIATADLPSPPGAFRRAMPADLDVLAQWTEAFVAEARIPEPVDARRVVGDSIERARLHVWDHDGPVSMAAWAGRTPSGVRINFVYTPRERRGRGYATACVRALTSQQLDQGSAFCWLYTNLAADASPNIFKRIGYWPVSDVAEYYLR